MEFADAIEFEPTTPEFIFSLFQDSFKQAQAAHEAEPDFELTINSTIAEWRDALLDDLFS